MAGASLSLLAACASRPEVQPALVPAPLVNAVFNDRLPSASPPVYSVGVVPAGYPSKLVPGAPARVVGGMATSVEVIAVFADSTRRLGADVEELLQRAGYARPVAPPEAGFTSGYSPTYNVYCSDSASVFPEHLSGANRNLLRVTFRPFRRGNGCPVARPALVATPEQLKIPALMPPPGVHVSSAGGGGGGGGVNSRAEVTGSDLVASAILAHYSAQLTGAGWRARTPAIGDQVAAQYFEATTPGGSQWSGVLMAVGGGKTLSLSLNMNLKANR